MVGQLLCRVAAYITLAGDLHHIAGNPHSAGRRAVPITTLSLGFRSLAISAVVAIVLHPACEAAQQRTVAPEAQPFAQPALSVPSILPVSFPAALSALAGPHAFSPPSVQPPRSPRWKLLPYPASDPQSPSPTATAKDQPGPVERGLKRGLEDQKQIYTAPFHRKNLKWDLLFLASTAGLIALDPHASDALSPDHADLSRVISDVGLYSTIGAVGLLGVSGFKNGDQHARETAVLSSESLANTFVVYAFTQLIAARQRPLEGNHNGDFFINHTLSSSFPSAHSAFTWSLASVVAHEYPRPWVQWLAYGTATTVSVTRFTGLKHFPSDVAVGAVFGYLIGQHIFHAHCTVGLSPSCTGQKSQSR